MLILASVVAVLSIEILTPRDAVLNLSTMILAVAFYAVVLFMTGFPNRFVQTIASMIGCGAILTLLLVATYVPSEAVFGHPAAALVHDLIMLWSVAVEGHIIARAIEQHLLVGLAIAAFVFVLQIGVDLALRAPA